MEVTDRELENCPWFWNSTRAEWLFRPEWALLRGSALTAAAEADDHQ